jgi:phospholipid transport system substrate-binding protein
MQKLLFIIAVLLANAGLAATVSTNQAETPDLQLKAVTAELLALIGRHKDVQPADAAKLEHVIQTKVVPLFNFERMTQIAMGGNWRLATAEQQKAVTREFRILLVRTYSAVLKSYRDESIEFQAFQPVTTDADVTVKSVIRKTGAPVVTIDYQMEKAAAGWKVYEINLDGINLIANYRETFAAKVRSDGVDGLIKALQDKNRQTTRA